MRTLLRGDTIGIVSPASAPSDGLYDDARNFLHRHGFESKLFGVPAPSFGRMSARDDVRAKAIHDAFLDPSVAAIICSRGGYGSGRLTEALDYSLIASHAKPFVGYSDITNLLMSMHLRTGITTFHGPMLGDLTTTTDEWSIERLFSMLSSEKLECQISNDNYSVLSPGKGQGRLIGGNISILCSMAGYTQFAANDDVVVALEDVGEFLYCLDRSLVQLERVGLFSNARAILIADMRLKDRGPDNSIGFSLEELLQQRFSALNIPIVFDLPIGHTSRQLTLPIGSKCEVDLTKDRLNLSFQDQFKSNSTKIAAE